MTDEATHADDALRAENAWLRAELTATRAELTATRAELLAQIAALTAQVTQGNEQVAKDNLALKKLGQKIGFDKSDEVLDASLLEVRKVMDHKALISALGNKDLKEKHWIEIFGLLPDGHTGSVLQFTLQSLIEKGIESYVEKVEEVSARASGEANILSTIAVIAEEWADLAFPVDSYRGMKDRYIIGKDIEEILVKLEDDQMTVGNCMGSRYVVDIRPDVELWEKRLSTISYVIDEMLTFQKSWMYLENIFNAEDIQKAMPGESKMF